MTKLKYITFFIIEKLMFVIGVFILFFCFSNYTYHYLSQLYTVISFVVGIFLLALSCVLWGDNKNVL